MFERPLPDAVLQSMVEIETICPGTGTVRPAAFALCPDCGEVGLQGVRFPPGGGSGRWLPHGGAASLASIAIRWNGVSIEGERGPLATWHWKDLRGWRWAPGAKAGETRVTMLPETGAYEHRIGVIAAFDRVLLTVREGEFLVEVGNYLKRRLREDGDTSWLTLPQVGQRAHQVGLDSDAVRALVAPLPVLCALMLDGVATAGSRIHLQCARDLATSSGFPLRARDASGGLFTVTGTLDLSPPALAIPSLIQILRLQAGLSLTGAPADPITVTVTGSGSTRTARLSVEDNPERCTLDVDPLAGIPTLPAPSGHDHQSRELTHEVGEGAPGHRSARVAVAACWMPDAARQAFPPSLAVA